MTRAKREEKEKERKDDEGKLIKLVKERLYHIWNIRHSCF